MFPHKRFCLKLPLKGIECTECLFANHLKIDIVATQKIFRRHEKHSSNFYILPSDIITMIAEYSDINELIMLMWTSQTMRTTALKHLNLVEDCKYAAICGITDCHIHTCQQKIWSKETGVKKHPYLIVKKLLS